MQCSLALYRLSLDSEWLHVLFSACSAWSEILILLDAIALIEFEG